MRNANPIILVIYVVAMGWPLVVGIAAAVEPADNPIVPAGAVLELLHARQAKLTSGLTEGPALAPDGSIYFTDMPFGTG